MYVCIHVFIGQLWNLINGKLANKSSVWKSNNEWFFKPAEGSLVFVENSKSNVLGVEGHAVVVQKFSENNHEQMWEISNAGVANNEGYFTLKNSASKKVLTAASAKKLEMKGIIMHLDK